jgi:acyl-CoA hydrolase
MTIVLGDAVLLRARLPQVERAAVRIEVHLRNRRPHGLHRLRRRSGILVRSKLHDASASPSPSSRAHFFDSAARLVRRWLAITDSPKRANRLCLFFLVFVVFVVFVFVVEFVLVELFFLVLAPDDFLFRPLLALDGRVFRQSAPTASRASVRRARPCLDHVHLHLVGSSGGVSGAVSAAFGARARACSASSRRSSSVPGRSSRLFKPNAP